VSDTYGSDRGTPIDRHYIEDFLLKKATDIRGHVLEFHDDTYTLRFGGAQVDLSDVLSVETTNPRATIVGDITKAESLPEASFDCIILTQVLQFIFDVSTAVHTLHRALKPGGVLLVTAPGLTRMGDQWPCYWSFTAAALGQLLRDRFGVEAVTVETHGNIFAATAFLYGIALEELDISELKVDDPRYPVVVAARAIKRD
jgi:SAM-dependent methyltransferase